MDNVCLGTLNLADPCFLWLVKTRNDTTLNCCFCQFCFSNPLRSDSSLVFLSSFFMFRLTLSSRRMSSDSRLPTSSTARFTASATANASAASAFRAAFSSPSRALASASCFPASATSEATFCATVSAFASRSACSISNWRLCKTSLASSTSAFRAMATDQSSSSRCRSVSHSACRSASTFFKWSRATSSSARAAAAASPLCRSKNDCGYIFTLRKSI